MNNIKYTVNGYKVSVIQELPKGYLVDNIHVDSEINEEFEAGKPYFIEKVYDSAPLLALDTNYLNLSNKITELQKQKNTIESAICNLRSEYENTLKTFKSFNDPCVKLFENILTGQITHFVSNRYNIINIITKSEFIKSSREWTLNMVFNMVNKSFKYKIYGEYNETDVFPCKSLEEAHQVVNEIIDKVFKDNESSFIENCVESAKRFNIKIPDGIEKRIKDKQVKSIKTQIDYKQRELDELTKRINSL